MRKKIRDRPRLLASRSAMIDAELINAVLWQPSWLQPLMQQAA